MTWYKAPGYSILSFRAIPNPEIPPHTSQVLFVGTDPFMDGRGRWIDNRFFERLWRSVKQEDIYVQDYADGLTAQRGLARWFGDYNTARPHQALGYATPAEVYHSPESY